MVPEKGCYPLLRRSFEDLTYEILKQTLMVYGERLVSLAVFGSVGRGVPGVESDVDLLIIIDNLPLGRMKRVLEFEKVEELVEPALQDMSKHGISTVISPVIKTREEVLAGSLLFLDMIEDARILYDKNGFFASFLDRLKKRLQKLGAKKIKYGGAWYWVLKEDYKAGETFEI
jgi:predicted nucleotidyltransferase